MVKWRNTVGARQALYGWRLCDAVLHEELFENLGWLKSVEHFCAILRDRPLSRTEGALRLRHLILQDHRGRKMAQTGYRAERASRHAVGGARIRACRCFLAGRSRGQRGSFALLLFFLGSASTSGLAQSAGTPSRELELVETSSVAIPADLGVMGGQLTVGGSVLLWTTSEVWALSSKKGALARLCA